MDFKSPPCVTEALQQVCEKGIFGYTEALPAYYRTVRNWFAGQFNWQPETDWCIITPGIVFALNLAIKAFTDPGDTILVQQPVYYPFTESVVLNGRALAVNQLIIGENNLYRIDYADFERQIKERKVKLFLLCSPHNPVGRVWTAEELLRLGEICAHYGVIVVSDEIHADFSLPGHQHQIFSAIRNDFANFTVTCTSPSKTFNLAGLQIANTFSPNPILRRAFHHELNRSGYGQPNQMGLAACRAAYQGGLEWLCQLKEYLKANLDYLKEFLQQKLPHIHLVNPEGTFLAWLDFRSLKLEDDELNSRIRNRAKLWLDPGPLFGAGGAGFQRLNYACPRSILERGLLQLYKEFLESDLR
jgi:cystathionine beta-lyase